MARVAPDVVPVPLTPSIRLHTLTGPLEQHWERLGTLPYWGHPWPGGQALARYLLDRPEVVRDRRVLDVASGSGVVAIAAALAGAAEVSAADVDPLARAAIELNAAVNGVRVRLVAEDLLAAAGPGGRASGWDVVLAGDACYEAGLARGLTTFLGRAADGGALVLLGDPGRTYCDPGGLRRLARYDVPTPEGVERDPVARTTVWQVPPHSRPNPGPEARPGGQSRS